MPDLRFHKLFLSIKTIHSTAWHPLPRGSGSARPRRIAIRRAESRFKAQRGGRRWIYRTRQILPSEAVSWRVGAFLGLVRDGGALHPHAPPRGPVRERRCGRSPRPSVGGVRPPPRADGRRRRGAPPTEPPHAARTSGRRPARGGGKTAIGGQNVYILPPYCGSCVKRLRQALAPS